MLEKQKKAEGEAYVSTVLFDNEIETIHDRVSIDKVSTITDKEYYVRGCTALLDAMGSTIEHIKQIHKYAREEDRPEKTVFVIITDGMENASRHYSFKDVKKLVEQQKEASDWEFLFLGANIDAIEVAGRCGIAEERAVNYKCDSVGTALNYEAVSDAVCTMRSVGGKISKNWKKAIEKDFAERN